jgi:hypothetical protein
MCFVFLEALISALRPAPPTVVAYPAAPVDRLPSNKRSRPDDAICSLKAKRPREKKEMHSPPGPRLASHVRFARSFANTIRLNRPPMEASDDGTAHDVGIWRGRSTKLCESPQTYTMYPRATCVNG